MLITISRRTVSDVAHSITHELVAAEIIGAEDRERVMDSVYNEVTDLANIGVRQDGPHIVVEINDEVFVKYAKVYVRVIRFVAPLLKPAKAFFAAFNEDVRDIENFMARRR